MRLRNCLPAAPIIPCIWGSPRRSTELVRHHQIFRRHRRSFAAGHRRHPAGVGNRTAGKEIPIALGILQALGLREGPEVISCPTCARTGHDVLQAAREVERHLAGTKLPLRVAVMGAPSTDPGKPGTPMWALLSAPNKEVLFLPGAGGCRFAQCATVARTPGPHRPGRRWAAQG